MSPLHNHIAQLWPVHFSWISKRFFAALCCCCCLWAAVAVAVSAQRQPPKQQPKETAWPANQFNVLVDTKSINETELRILSAIFDELEFKTCVKVHKLSLDYVNPYQPGDALAELERNFVYIFKSQFGLFNKSPSTGLSSLGCVRQGRQSMILPDLAFEWPDLLLKYHILRSLGVEQLDKPDLELKRRLQQTLPLSQKIASQESSTKTQRNNFASAPFDEPPSIGPFTYARNPLSAKSITATKTSSGSGSGTKTPLATRMMRVKQQANNYMAQSAGYLSSSDVTKVKQLYNCIDYQNKLSVNPPPGKEPKFESSPDDADDVKLAPEGSTDPQSQSQTQQQSTNNLTFENYAINSDNDCKPMQFCPLVYPASNPKGEESPQSSSDFERPMLLKLDSFHAQDPQLKQANQINLKAKELPLSNQSTYRLMDAPEFIPYSQPSPQSTKSDQLPNSQQQQSMQFQQQSLQQNQQNPNAKTEMMISFEQSQNVPGADPVTSLASSQVLKLCSCTCQTMTPFSQSSTVRPSSTLEPTLQPIYPSSQTMPPSSSSTQQQQEQESSLPPRSTETTSSITTSPTIPSTPSMPTTPIPEPSQSTSTTTTFTVQPTPSELPPTESIPSTTPTPPTPIPPTEEPTEVPQPQTQPPLPSPQPQPKPDQPATEQPYTTTENYGSSSVSPPLVYANSCDQVAWLKPNKTVYSSSKIVWDVDRGNQNYFICNNLVNGELVPGKTHGFSCRVSNEGKMYEMHDFKVLTKPESINLAWISKSSDSLGTRNLPVIGGYSKSQDPFVVARCMVRDENNDVITLIGYVNNQGTGWFPFDGIQIECGQYDVLACVS